MANNNNLESESSNGGQAEIGHNANTSARRSQDESRKAETPAAPPLPKQLSNNVVSSPSPVASPRNSRTASPVRQSSRPQPLANPPSTQPSAAAIQRALSAANTPQLQSTAGADGATRLPRAPKSAGAADTAPHWPTSPRLKSPPPSESNSRRGSSTNPKKIETGNAPSISVQNPTPQTTTPPPIKQGGDPTAKPSQLATPAKAPSRGASGKSVLETVRENSTDEVKEEGLTTTQPAADSKPSTRLSDDENQSAKRDKPVANGELLAQQVESGSESAGTRSPKKKEQNDQSQRPKNAQTKSYASLGSTKSRQQEGKQNMTVETETVPSIPQSAMNVGDRSSAARGENSSSIKPKPSNEAMRPKKERKKPTQKARSINQGTGMFYDHKSPLLTSQAYVEETADESGSGSSRSSSTAREVTSSGADSPLPKRQLSYSRHLRSRLSFPTPTQFIRTLSNRYIRKASSKADIFEQRVANAVDEANSSDSDETFVYESNPIDPQRRPRHHSRTPSVTSSHSVADQQRTGVRNFGDVMDERRVAGKRSMKFSNNAYNDIDTPDGKDGSVRSHTPRHFGRFGRGGSQQSMFDPDSPFTQASKLRSNQLHARNSRPNSPRSPHNLHQQQQKASGVFGKKHEPSYDFDAEVGDDERTPLVGTVRTPRGARLARRITRSPSIDEYYGVRRRSRCGKVGGYLLALVVFTIVLCSTVAFLVMSNRPLSDVRILRINNVLASEQELMLDLCVSAVNPNTIGITVTDMDINIFAKSKHVGSGGSVAPITAPKWRSRRKWRERSIPTAEETGEWLDLSEHWHAPTGGVDEGTDPPDDDLDRDAQTMLLGRIFHFDQALTFEGSPLKRHARNSTGALRLEKPGNKTETGGSERWERVLQNPFELIVRGLLKYQLPITSRLQTAEVGSSVIVHPEDASRLGKLVLEILDD